MTRIPKIRAGQPVGGHLLSAGYFDYEPVQADRLIELVREECDMSAAVEVLIRQPNVLCTGHLRLNIVAINAGSVVKEGVLHLADHQRNLWSGLLFRTLRVEVPFRLAAAKLHMDHPGQLWYRTELAQGWILCRPPKTEEESARRVLDISPTFEPVEADLVVIGVW